MLTTPDTLFILLPLATLVFLRFAYLTVNRLVLHPLAKIPGPKLAALTHLYEFYHDALRPGKFTFRIDELHRKYGEPCAWGSVLLLIPSRPRCPYQSERGPYSGS